MRAPSSPTARQVLGRNDKAQSTLVASWLTELLLDGINRAALEAGGAASGDAKYAAAVEQLRWGEGGGWVGG
jgi:hypothetical protein